MADENRPAGPPARSVRSVGSVRSVRSAPQQTSAPSGETRPVVHEALGQSEDFLAFQERLSRVAPVERSVLLVGERGTGKELAAARIHFLSPRWQEPFIALNCAALPSSLIEAELFGHEAGAFTGAVRYRKGRFEAADGGTLFLDELGNIPIEAQEKILRVVEYGMFERVGSSEPIHVNVRIVGATNADLRSLAAQGRFKQDLLDRLSFEVLFVPPLRERREDILLIANHFAARMVLELGRGGIIEFSEEAIRVLEAYPWPGNIRELKNVIERAVYRSEEGVVTARDIEFDPFRPPYTPLAEPEAPEPAKANAAFSDAGSIDKPFDAAVGDLECALLRRALEGARFNQRKAAQLLGLTYHQFRGVYRKHRKSIENLGTNLDGGASKRGGNDET